MPEIIKISLKTRTDKSYDIVLGNNILSNLGQAVKKLKCGNSIFIITDKNVARFYLKKTITALNFREAKNLIGAFWQPKMVYMDTAVLNTLPLRELKCGLAEAIKYGVIKDSSLFSFFEKNMRKLLNYDKTALNKMIPVCAGIKAKITSADERDDKDIRIILNYGHTLGHAIEAATNYKKFHHGEAVGIGMVLAAKLAVKLGCLCSCEATRIESLIRKAGLPVSAKGIEPKKILASMKRDKKFVSGVNRFVLPISIGKVKIVENIPEDIIANILTN